MKRLDFKTALFLNIIGAKKEKNILRNGEDKELIKKTEKNIVYVFESYDDFKTYFEEYLGSVDEDLINMAIVTRSSKGQVIALKGLCENIIVKVQMKREYDKLTDQKVKEIHHEGKLTSFVATK